MTKLQETINNIDEAQSALRTTVQKEELQASLRELDNWVGVARIQVGLDDT